MKRNIAFLLYGLAAALILSGVFTLFNNRSAAGSQALEQWEYLVVTDVYYLKPEPDKINKIVGIVNICQMNAAGCRNYQIEHELDYGKFMKNAELPETFQTREAASRKAAETAFYKALAQLGSEGWELIHEPVQGFGSVSLYKFERFEQKSYLFSRDTTKAVYFKRLKNRTYNDKE